MIEPMPPSPTAHGAMHGPRPLAGFLLDLVIAIATLLLVSLGCGVIWGVYRGVALALQARQRGEPLVSEQVAAAIGQPGALAQMLIALVSTASAALLLYFWRRRATAAERAASRRAMARPAIWAISVAVALAVFLGSSLVSVVLDRLGVRPVPTNLALMQQALQHWPGFLLVFVVLLAPAYEELLFRRVLFGRLLAAGRPLLGIVLSSFVFALMHELPGVSGNGPAAMLVLWLVYGAMGAAFAWLYWRSGTLWAPILAHSVNNAAALASLYWLGVH